MKRRKISLLIGEDDVPVARHMQGQLQSLGYRVKVEAGTPHAVVVLAINLRPDVIVLDLNISGDTRGIGVAREIHDTARIPIVFVASFAKDVVDNDHAIPRPYRYVTKPYVLQQLDEAIQELSEAFCPSTADWS